MDRVLEIRMWPSERLGHDPVKIGEHLMELQAQHQGHLIRIDGGEPRKDDEPAA